MKYIQLLLLTFFVGIVCAQDGVSPLTANPDLFVKERPLKTKALKNSFDSTFHYITDTLSLPIFDDFSRNKFQQYNAGFTDPNVTEELFHRMLDENTNNPLAAETKLTSTKTYRSEYNANLDTTIHYYYDSIRFLYDDLMEYAPDYVQTYAYPPYIIYDTLDGTGNIADTVWLNEVEYVQDSARVFIATINDPEKIWLNNQAYHNYRFAENP